MSLQHMSVPRHKDCHIHNYYEHVLWVYPFTGVGVCIAVIPPGGTCGSLSEQRARLYSHDECIATHPQFGIREVAHSQDCNMGPISGDMA